MKLADRGMLEMITFLVDHGAEVSKLSGAENFTALMKACKKGHATVVQYLLDQGADVDAVDKVSHSLFLIDRMEMMIMDTS